MTYKELFKDFYADNVMLQFVKSIHLFLFLEQLAETSPTLKLIVTAIERRYKGKIHPDELIAILREMGFPEWSDLEKFMGAVDSSDFKADTYLNMLDPAFPEIEETERIYKSDDLYDIFVKENFPLPESLCSTKLPFYFIDAYMEMPSDIEIHEIVQACPSDMEKYLSEKRDCDDFSKIFQGWMSRKGYGNLTFGWIYAYLHYENKNAVYHAFMWAVSKEGNIWLFDPQSDKYIWKHGETPTIPNVVRIEPRVMGV